MDYSGNKYTLPLYQSNLVDYSSHNNYDNSYFGQMNAAKPMLHESSFHNYESNSSRINQIKEINIEHKMAPISFNEGFDKKDDLAKLDDLITKFNNIQ